MKNMRNYKRYQKNVNASFGTSKIILMNTVPFVKLTSL